MTKSLWQEAENCEEIRARVELKLLHPGGLFALFRRRRATYVAE